MAALAALGGITSTYINAIGDAIQSVVGFAGTTQWAAGLHVLWIVLAVGLIQKPGTGTVTGIIKGFVELLTGNTHGLLVLLIDIIAGVLVDLGFLPFKNKNRLSAYLLAGGLAAASNVFVFQLFAALPAEIIAYGALILVGVVAFVSGALFGGVLGYLLVNSLRRSGVIKYQKPLPVHPRLDVAVIVLGLLLSGVLFYFLRLTYAGSGGIQVSGAVTNPYEFRVEQSDIEQVTRESTLRDVSTAYSGYPLKDVISLAAPSQEAAMVLMKASDGYAFFLSMEEINTNASILLVPQGKGDDAAFNIVGPENSKAWIRGVVDLVVVSDSKLDMTGKLEKPGVYDPEEWQFEMDSTQLDVGYGSNKYQGAPLGAVIEALGPLPEAQTILILDETTETSLQLAEIMGNDDIRIFTIIHDELVSFAIATMSGEVIVPQVLRIEVQ